MQHKKKHFNQKIEKIFLTHKLTRKKMLENTNLKSLLMWDNPIQSGIVAGSMFATLFFFGIMNYTILTFVCRTVQAVMLVFAAAAYIGKPLASRETIVQMVKELHEAFVPQMWQAVDAVARIITWENRTTTMEVLVASLLLAMLGNCFSDLTLIFLITVAFFAGPVFYAHNKAVVDGQLDNIKELFDRLLQQGADGLRDAAISLSPARREQQQREREQLNAAGSAAGAASSPGRLNSTTTLLDSTLREMREPVDNKKTK